MALIEHKDGGLIPDKRVPTLGRIVHFQTAEAHLPAIVTRVISATMVNLQVFLDAGGDGVRHQTNVEQGTGPRTWHWPEQV
jgi:hypothetical protein